ncbi:hypothetical protein GCM10009742_15340 [Kribbella karoonensis]|uniref:Uncharacterized protein n=1 Tax=Kribbella karoonensis TaxID=324851 RepID=A0ABN2D9Z6_9ACTN
MQTGAPEKRELQLADLPGDHLCVAKLLPTVPGRTTERRATPATAYQARPNAQPGTDRTCRVLDDIARPSRQTHPRLPAPRPTLRSNPKYRKPDPTQGSGPSGIS